MKRVTKKEMLAWVEDVPMEEHCDICSIKDACFSRPKSDDCPMLDAVTDAIRASKLPQDVEKRIDKAMQRRAEKKAALTGHRRKP